ncbi:GntR family transcriptional regulator [Pollutimonas harenae]|uniref:GntR family transcriptional regulator n=1 Tax=Pollutimonas harenae TaxID=657015 RepID=A0A853GXT1_9BURK|nr:GntR family transcriptional regulator [Pollutimonas harenae]NYT84590.1 GntR family transcriptional regulator [Pollutimonas harenae]TEA73018.1 GntR family transcriptional regulator [Pollutimonas harenae]
MKTNPNDNVSRAYNYIREKILDRVYLPGERLIGSEIAEALGSSRTPVREAFAQLEQNGLVEKTGWGFTVRSMTLKDIEDLFDVREILELKAARKALAYADDAWVASLQTIVAKSGKLVRDGRPVESIRMARSVYTSIAERANNRVLSTMLAGISDQIQLVGGILVWRLPWRAEEVFQENQDIVSAFAQRDADRVVTAVRRHILRSRVLHLSNKEGIRAT